MSPNPTPPRPLRNVLFIMADQLRWDYLGCAGHPTLRTPNLDALAARGVRFTQAYVQGPVCGASRMSTYTGRYVSSHGSCWNFVPLSVGQKTLGDHVVASRPADAERQMRADLDKWAKVSERIKLQLD